EGRQLAQRGLHSLIVELATIQQDGRLPDERLRSAFDTLQSLRTRPLVERTLGPQRPAELPARLANAPMTADSLQHAFLRDEDLILDLWLGSRASYLFALTRDS